MLLVHLCNFRYLKLGLSDQLTSKFMPSAQKPRFRGVKSGKQKRVRLYTDLNMKFWSDEIRHSSKESLKESLLLMRVTGVTQV